MAKASPLDPKTEEGGICVLYLPHSACHEKFQMAVNIGDHCAQQGSPLGRIVPMLRADTNEEMISGN